MTLKTIMLAFMLLCVPFMAQADGIALGSTALICSSGDAPGNPGDGGGPEQPEDVLIIKRHPVHNDCRIFTYELTLTEKTSEKLGLEWSYSGALALSEARHTKDDYGFPASRFTLSNALTAGDKAVDIAVSTWSPHEDANIGYADVYIQSQSSRTILRFEGCQPRGLFEPHRMNDDVCPTD